MSGGGRRIGNLVSIHFAQRCTIVDPQPRAGQPQHPTSYDQVADKLRDCAEYARWPKEKSERIVAAVRTLESIPDIRQLTALLAAERG